MHVFHLVAPAPEMSVWLFENNGPTRVFCSRLALAQWLGRADLRQLAATLRSVRQVANVCAPLIIEHRWMARQGDATLTADDLLPLLPHRRILRGRLGPDDAGYRCQSVPNISSRPGRYRSLLRAPRTLGLLREAGFARHEPDENVPAVRARLRERPTAWDDQIRSDVNRRNWKHRRAHQWKTAD
jgi:hypothetical protein